MEYRGIKWSNNKNLAKKLGKSESFVRKMRDTGKTYEEIIDHVLDKTKSYKGFTWETNKELSHKLGKSEGYVKRLLNEGKTHEEIIDFVLNKEENKVIHEYKGIKWDSNRSLSKALGKYDSYVSYYSNKGKTYEEIIDEVLSEQQNK